MNKISEDDHDGNLNPKNGRKFGLLAAIFQKFRDVKNRFIPATVTTTTESTETFLIASNDFIQIPLLNLEAVDNSISLGVSFSEIQIDEADFSDPSTETTTDFTESETTICSNCDFSPLVLTGSASFESAEIPLINRKYFF